MSIRIPRHGAIITCCIAFGLGFVASAGAQSSWEVFTDDFETGDLSKWVIVGGNCEATSSAAQAGLRGLEVTVSDGEHISYKSNLDGIFDKECSFSFDFDPNDVSIPASGDWPPAKSLRIASLLSSPPRKTMAALYIRRNGDGAYTAYLGWEEADGMHYAYNTAREFSLADAWRRITLDVEVDSRIRVWVDGVLESEITGTAHAGFDVEYASLGKMWPTSNGPSGSIRFDNASFELPRIDDLWASAAQTDCSSRNGLTRAQAFCTIREAADLAGPGTVVHILAGTYNEHVAPSYSGENRGEEYTIYQAETVGSVTIDGGGLDCDEARGVFEVYEADEVKSYIRITGLAIENPITAAGCDRDGIFIKGGRNIIVSEVSITDSSGLDPVDADSVGVYIVNSENVIVQNSSIYNTRSSAVRFEESSNIIIDGNDIQKGVNGGMGETVAAAVGASYFEIRNNAIHNGSNLDVGGGGIDVKNGAHHGGVRDNHVYDMPGDTYIYVDAHEFGVHDVEVSGNLVECSPEGGNGIALSSEQGGLLTGIRVYNNVVYDCSGAGIEVTTWGTDGMKTDIGIMNNTVYNNGLTWGGGILVSSDLIENVDISNNISCGNYRWQIGVLIPETGEVSGSHNLVNGDLDEGVPGTADCGWNDCYEFAGSSRIAGDPGFADTTPGAYDFRLVPGSPAVDSATDALVDPDLDGVLETLSFGHDEIPRPQDGDVDNQAIPDRGAYEYYPYTDSTWTGAVSDYWNAPANWSPEGVPGSLNEALIPDVSGNRFPLASATPSEAVYLVKIDPNASLTIDASTSLNVLHSFTTSGRVEISGSLILE